MKLNNVHHYVCMGKKLVPVSEPDVALGVPTFLLDYHKGNKLYDKLVNKLVKGMRKKKKYRDCFNVINYRGFSSVSFIAAYEYCGQDFEKLISSLLEKNKEMEFFINKKLKKQKLPPLRKVRKEDLQRLTNGQEFSTEALTIF